ncbi:alpha/beta hydrolase family protein [Streptomyces hayashii]|uniref:alpha/beta hydrolase family protein n=1 Tax=Streptomyces hayashii TaxID=2839966 RepID=UPI00403C5FCC
MIRARRIGVTAVAALAALAGTPGLAQARPPSETRPLTTPADSALPSGWRVAGDGAARELVWRSPRRVPVGDARVSFHAGDRLLGVPRPGGDGRTFRLPLDAVGDTPLKDLRVLAGGRRLDVPAAGSARGQQRSRTTPQLPAPLPANSVDPGRPGSYRTLSGEYDLPAVRLPGYAQPVEMRAVVVAPKGATGKRPLALFLHGRHVTCYKPGAEDDVNIDWPCAAGTKEVPSYKGYLKDQRLLASQGYVTVSISANGINGQDGAAEDAGAQGRSSLVRLHLARWADWAAHPGSAPAAVRAAPRADLSKVLLVGHSRGGEGVNRAAMDSLYRPPAAQDGYRGPVRWKIRGTVLIGPTVFGQNPVADVPSASILPGCDGDVSDLEGETYLDGTRGVSHGTALHSAVYVIGANHNFFNSEWTPGQAEAPASDDFYDSPQEPDAVCSANAPTRLSADQQHQAGATYIAAAARLFVGGDDRVRPLLDGTGRRAPSADPARVLTHAVGARRSGGFLPDGGVKVTGGRVCRADSDPARACLGEDALGTSPHFGWWDVQTDSAKSAVAMRWSAPGGPTRITSVTPVSLAGARSLALRVFVPPNTAGTALDVAVTDSAGRRAGLGRITVDGLPGSSRTASYWARELRVPLTAATRAGLDLRHVKSLSLTPRSASGQAWFMDSWGWAPGTPAVKAAALPRIDVGRLTVKEGDSGARTYHVPVRVSGHGAGTARFYVVDPRTGEATEKVVTVRPGATPIDVPVEVKGDALFGDDEEQNLFVKAVRGTVVGSDRGGVTALNDDPAPTVTLTPAVRATEGEPLTWRISLSAPAETHLWYPLRLLPVTGGAELSTKDVDPQWLENVSGRQPDPELPLSQVEMYVGPDVLAGATSAEFSIPTVKDQVAEPEESVRLTLTDESGEPLSGAPTATGTVVDTP